MLSIRLMTSHDFKFAVTLTDTMNWNMAEDDFSFMVALEPQGCFILSYSAKPIGLATSITFDHVGWIGNVIVDHRFRRQGAGSFLVQHAIHYLESQDVTTIYIYAYPAKESFYQRLGFNKESNFIVLRGSLENPSQTPAFIIPATEKLHEAIIDFDYRCLGYSRNKLLSSILSLSSTHSYLAIKNNVIHGYAIIKDYDSMAELGPVVCTGKTKKMISDLVYSALRDHSRSDTFMCIPQNECALVNSLKSSGFQEDFRVIRMFRGFSLNIGCVQIAESLERG